MTEALSFLSRHKWIVLSAALSAVIVVMTKAPTGDMLGGFTDHFHHARITWTFLNLGFDTYTKPFEETGKLVSYPMSGVTWEKYGLAYPPGMLVVFLPTALIGKYIPMTEMTFGKLSVVYLTALMHGALAATIPVVRRVREPIFTALFVILWIFGVRATLLGFYEGAWLWCAVLGVRALKDDKPDWAVLWLVASTVISFRAVALAPIGLAAWIALVRAPASARLTVARKLGITAVAIVGCAVVLWTFAVILKHGPPPKPGDPTHGVGSMLLPMSFRPWVILYLGLGIGVITAIIVDPVVGSTTALCTVLAIFHAGYPWHGTICFAPFLALALSRRPSFPGLILIGFWILYILYSAFAYGPFRGVEELIRFFEYNGNYSHPGWCI